MRDDFFLSDYGISNGSTVELSYQLKGGGKFTFCVLDGMKTISLDVDDNMTLGEIKSLIKQTNDISFEKQVFICMKEEQVLHFFKTQQCEKVT